MAAMQSTHATPIGGEMNVVLQTLCCYPMIRCLVVRGLALQCLLMPYREQAVHQMCFGLGQRSLCKYHHIK